jgi:GntR family transcriptional regulator/MocR family aminotransferase
VVAAVDELIAEGYAEGRHGSGVFVASDLPDHVLRAAEQAAPPPDNVLPRPDEVRPFQPAAPELALFPHEIWAKLMLKTWRNPIRELLASPDPLGWAPLRLAIADHLRAFRGMRCAPEQVVITSGAGEALELLVQSILKRGDKVLIEEPGYVLIRRTFSELGLKTVAIPVDEGGLDIGKGTKDARAAVVTPARHYPLGMTMPLSRRLALLDWARSHKSWIIEDDYDSEFRYDGHPIASLQGLDATRRVIYAGTFSKALLPGFRVGYLIVPDDLVAAFRAVRPIIDRFPAPLHQLVVADFLNEGYFPAHLRRLRESHRAARDNLAFLLKARLSDHLIAPVPEQGIHFTVSSTGTWRDDRALAEAALKGGVVVIPVSPMHISASPEPRLLLGFSGLTADEAEVAVARLGRVLETVAG